MSCVDIETYLSPQIFETLIFPALKNLSLQVLGAGKKTKFKLFWHTVGCCHSAKDSSTNICIVSRIQMLLLLLPLLAAQELQQAERGGFRSEHSGGLESVVCSVTPKGYVVPDPGQCDRYVVVV